VRWVTGTRDGAHSCVGGGGTGPEWLWIVGLFCGRSGTITNVRLV
jgi:hypothetical protein